jgi:hypothetical protein
MDPEKVKKEDMLKHIPKEGFLKLTQDKPDLPEDKRIALIRKGNELYNSGHFDLAKKVFLTAGYNDGLIRIGDRLSEQQKHLEAFRMYWLARHEAKTNNMVEKMSWIVRQWMHE